MIQLNSFFWGMLLLMGSYSNAVFAFAGNAQKPPLKPAASRPDSTPKVVNIIVFHADPKEQADSRYLQKDSTGNEYLVVHPKNTLCFEISNPVIFLKSRPNDKAKVVLYINGMEMHGICTDWYSGVTAINIQQNKVPVMRPYEKINLVLVRNPTSQASWNFLYNNISRTTDSYINVEGISIGWENMAPLDTASNLKKVRIAFFYQWEIWVWGLVFIAILIIFFILAYTTDVIRDRDNGPFSLSFTQLLFWTALVMGGFIYTLLLTDTPSSFNSSILLLMGISLTTTGFASLIDGNKLSTHDANPKKHISFFKDLLTDGNSYSVQRVQAFAWNLILGIYFVIYTINNKEMPEFSSTLLFLAGFSSTSYLAAKLPENTATKPKPSIEGDVKKPAAGGATEEKT